MRALTFILGLTVMISVVTYPRFIATDMHSVPHGWLAVLMLGMSACFVYGSGFRPDNRFLRILFSAPIAWALVAVGASAVLLKNYGCAFGL